MRWESEEKKKYFSGLFSGKGCAAVNEVTVCGVRILGVCTSTPGRGTRLFLVFFRVVALSRRAK